jgi:hypothetical protein
LDEMNTPTEPACPRCDYPLVPVHAVEGSKRRVIALSCPEPYCDHMQMLPSELASELSQADSVQLRAAN